MGNKQEHQNRSAAQRTRRLRERLTSVEQVQEAIIDVTVENSSRLNDVEERLAALERERC